PQAARVTRGTWPGRVCTVTLAPRPTPDDHKSEETMGGICVTAETGVRAAIGARRAAVPAQRKRAHPWPYSLRMRPVRTPSSEIARERHVPLARRAGLTFRRRLTEARQIELVQEVV